MVPEPLSMTMGPSSDNDIVSFLVTFQLQCNKWTPLSLAPRAGAATKIVGAFVLAHARTPPQHKFLKN
jgi:hypothetical protein